MSKRKIRQVLNKESGIYHLVNESVEQNAGESPGGYFIEKSRKTELFRLQERQTTAETPKEKSWIEKIKEWFFG